MNVTTGASVFSKLIRGELPSYSVFEDEHTFAFLSLDAIQLGHTLIVPKVEVDYFVDVPEPYYSAVFRNARPLAQAIHRATKCRRVGAVIAGWDVPHFHYHLVPMFDYSDLDPKRARIRSHEENTTVQARIIAELAVSETCDVAAEPGLAFGGALRRD
jgi:histidine triad (HIT) family protein